ncbi:MAG TPA: thermonuclease family protein [Hyphomonadaceae bacterium]|nr:thermonuclease family protein [Hyphomonadaceae bacterium]HPI47581.1 thermonuclease family protein [Hyphomonadaceae bacterium]
MIAALIALQLAATAPTSAPGEAPIRSLALESYRVKDGDTLRDLGRGHDIRVYGIDTPETDAPCETVKVLGIAARARVVELLANAEAITYAPAWNVRGQKDWPLDGRGRRIAVVRVDGQDIADILFAEGLGRAYDGKNAREDWCGQ